MKLYLAHPISSLSYDEVMAYYKGMQVNLKGHYNLLCPMVAKKHLAYENKFHPEGYENPVSNKHSIVERDYWMVASADVVLVDLSQSNQLSIGCVMELAWAFQLRKHTIVVVPENKIYQHAFIGETADIIFTEISDAISYLIELSEEV